MALSLILSEGGNKPDSINTEARVEIQKEGEGFAIKKIELATVGRVPGIDEAGLPEGRGGGEGELPGLEGARRGARDQRRGAPREQLSAGLRSPALPAR